MVALAIVVLVTLGSIVGCSERGVSGPTKGCEPRQPIELAVEIERRLPHDPESYTQGLVIVDGVLFESSGLYGESALSSIDMSDGQVLQTVRLPEGVFAEGLTASGDRELIQLTWKEGTAFRWAIDGFDSSSEPLGRFSYSGEGWGLTTLDDGQLLMSDGSNRLFERDPSSFAVTAIHDVERVGGRSDLLNELDFDGRWVWANRYQSNEILRIDPRCWSVDAVVDVGALRDEAEQLASAAGSQVDVPNGIAFDHSSGTFVVTGKLWPIAFDVNFSEYSL